MALQLGEAEKQILGALLKDFINRKLTASQLRKGYEGPAVSLLKAAICADDDITTVDFDLALEDLENKELVTTAPHTKRTTSSPAGTMLFIAVESMRKYLALTEDGYRKAKEPPSKPAYPQKATTSFNFTGGNFENFQVAAGASVTQSMSVKKSECDEVLSKLIHILENQGKVVNAEDHEDLTTAIDKANAGEGNEAKSLLKKVCGPLWESLQPTMWPIVGELVKKSLGI